MKIHCLLRLLMDCGGRLGFFATFICNHMGRIWLWERSDDNFNLHSRVEVVRRDLRSGALCFDLNPKAGFFLWFTTAIHAILLILVTLFLILFLSPKCLRRFYKQKFLNFIQNTLLFTLGSIFIQQSALLLVGDGKKNSGRGLNSEGSLKSLSLSCTIFYSASIFSHLLLSFLLLKNSTHIYKIK